MLNSRSQPEGPLNWTTSSLAAPEEASLFHNITVRFAPARGRGLKRAFYVQVLHAARSPPRGGVD
jgi:hypothetical protein